MSINLNEFKTETENVKIFNNGVAGRVKNLSLSIQKKTTQDNKPDFNLVFTDENGGILTDGFYYPTENTSDKKANFDLRTLVTILHTIRPDMKENPFPNFEDYKKAFDFLIKNISQSSNGVKVNIFANYGTKGNPSSYLGLRKPFNFIELNSVGDNETRLTARISNDPSKSNYDDVLERIIPTEFPNEESDGLSTESGGTTTSENWV